MIIEEIMRKDVASLSPAHTIADAMHLMETKKIRHIPITDNQQHLLGLVTIANIRAATPSIFHANEHPEDVKKPLESIMVKDPITCHPLDFVEETAGLFYEHKISCVPIINQHKLVGIVTETDLLRTMIELTGVHQPGSQIEIRVPDISGALSDIVTVIRKRKANILSVLVYPDRESENYKILVIRVRMMNPTGLIEELKAAGHQVLWPNLPGMNV